MELTNSFKIEVLNAVKEAGQCLKSFFYKGFKVFHKDTIDLVTEADLNSENILKDRLRNLNSEFPVVAEESFDGKVPGGFYWLVDPLDGTTNFAHRIPWFSVSVALMDGKAPLFGVVYNPATEEMFVAERGKGCFLNDKPVKVSSTSKLIDSLLATGFPVSKILKEPDRFVPLFKEVMTKSQGVRRFGSAALDLAYVACGRYDGFWEAFLKPWDTAAGMLLVLEAGGKVTDYYGKPFDPFCSTVVATNGLIHEELLSLTSMFHPEYLKPHRNPFPTVDIIIEFEDGIVLIYRKNYPQGWAIPGGFVDYGETLEQAAIREAKEETNLDVELVGLLGCYSDPKRDPRFHTVSTVFVAKGKGSLKGMDDAKEAKVFKLSEIPWKELVFDHAKILKDYLNWKKKNES